MNIEHVIIRTNIEHVIVRSRFVSEFFQNQLKRTQTKYLQKSKQKCPNANSVWL